MRLLHPYGPRLWEEPGREGEPTKAFEPSLVWATVMSRPAEDRANVDAGLKTPYTAVPAPVKNPGYARMSA